MLSLEWPYLDLSELQQPYVQILFKFSGFSLCTVYYEKIVDWKPKSQRFQLEFSGVDLLQGAK